MDLTGKQLGPYQINSTIGRGGMAVIYRSVDTRTSEVVALKVMLPHLLYEAETQHRFQKEGENAKRLIHPNIVRVYEAGQIDGHFYIAMEYATGGTLAGLLKSRSRPMNVNEALPILYRVAAALDYAHNRGILHRDIKLSNILIGRNNQILLSDFGIARRLGNDHTMVTATGYTVGTPAYMSPEQARGDDTIDHRADIYSLGVVAYVMLTHAMPFDADTPLVLLRKVIDLPPTPPEKANPQLPAGVSYVLRRVLAKNPNHRYPSANEFVHALETGITRIPSAEEQATLSQLVVEPTPVTVRPETKVAPRNPQRSEPIVQLSQPRPSRRGWPLLIGGAIMIVLMAIAIQTWDGNLTTLLRTNNQSTAAADTQISANQPEAATVENSPSQLVEQAPTSAAIAPIVLTSFVDSNWGFSLDLPKQWTKSRQGNKLYFEAPDHFAWAFVEPLPAIGNTTNAAQLLNDYLASDKTPFQSYQADSDVARTINSPTSHEQHFQATLLGGAQFTGRIVAVIKEQQAFIYGVSLAPQAEESLSAVAAMIIDSFAIAPQAVAETTTVAPTATMPPATNTATPSVKPSPSVGTTATPLTTAEAASTQTAIAAVVDQKAESRITNMVSILDRIPITSTPTVTATTNGVRTRLPTSTPVQDTPTPIATLTPTVTPTQIVTPSQATPNLPTQNSVGNTIVPPSIAVNLISPDDGATLDNKMTLSWSATSSLPSGYLFEPVFWQDREDPMKDGRGYAGTTTGTSLGVTAELFRPTGEGEYYWGILLVKEAPYQRVTFLGGKWLLRVKLLSPTVQIEPSLETIADNAQVTLEQPDNGDTLMARITFRWTPNFTLPEGYAFEPVFWFKGESAMQGLGYGGATENTEINLGPDNFALPGEYFWSVILVKLEPYERIKNLSIERIIRVEFESSSSNSSSDGNKDK